MADVDFKKPSVPLIQAAECKKPRPEYKSVIKPSHPSQIDEAGVLQELATILNRFLINNRGKLALWPESFRAGSELAGNRPEMLRLDVSKSINFNHGVIRPNSAALLKDSVDLNELDPPEAVTRYEVTRKNDCIACPQLVYNRNTNLPDPTRSQGGYSDSVIVASLSTRDLLRTPVTCGAPVLLPESASQQRQSSRRYRPLAPVRTLQEKKAMPEIFMKLPREDADAFLCDNFGRRSLADSLGGEEIKEYDEKLGEAGIGEGKGKTFDADVETAKEYLE